MAWSQVFFFFFEIGRRFIDKFPIHQRDWSMLTGGAAVRLSAMRPEQGGKVCGFRRAFKSDRQCRAIRLSRKRESFGDTRTIRHFPFERYCRLRLALNVD